MSNNQKLKMTTGSVFEDLETHINLNTSFLETVYTDTDTSEVYKLSTFDRNNPRKWRISISVSNPLTNHYFTLSKSHILSQLGIHPFSQPSQSVQGTSNIDLSCAMKGLFLTVDQAQANNHVNPAKLQLRFPTSDQVISYHTPFRDPKHSKSKRRLDYTKAPDLKALTIHLKVTNDSDAEPFNLYGHTLHMRVAIAYLVS